MSLAEEDTELRDLLAQTLESNGTLGKLRAQLRASIFLLLDSYDSSQNNIPTIKTELKELLKSDLGKDVLFLITDLLKFYNLEHTLAVLKPECGVDNLITDSSNTALKTVSIQSNGDKPLLLEVLSRIEKLSPKEPAFVNPTNDLTDAQVEDAYRKFRQYDTDKNGSIDKQELRMLFQDMFPGFNRNMLERYVNDEFRSVDKNFTNSIDREEFIGVYRRLFLQCRTVVVNPPRSGSSSPRKSESSSLSSRPARSFANSNSAVNSSTALTRPALSPQGSSLDEDPFFEDQPRSTGLKSIHSTSSISTIATGSRIPKALSNSTANHSVSPTNKLGTTTPSSTTSSSVKFGNEARSTSSAPQTGIHSSLQDLPALNGASSRKDDNRKETLQQSRSHLDKQLGLIGDLKVDELDDNDYTNDDFEEDVKSGARSARSDRSGWSEMSERSERSEKSDSGKRRGVMSYDVEVADIDDEAEVEEDINLSQSATDDIVTDRTVDSDRSLGVDYLEDAVARRF